MLTNLIDPAYRDIFIGDLNPERMMQFISDLEIITAFCKKKRLK